MNLRGLYPIKALEEIAALTNLSNHPNITALSGEFAGWFRLRTGVYRSILQPRREDAGEVFYVDYIEPRGDSY